MDSSSSGEAPVGRRQLLGVVAALLSACVVRGRPANPHERRAWRRMRRRARRRIRRRVAWRMVTGRRVVVVPTDLDGDDVIVLEDGRLATVVDTDVRAGRITVDVDGAPQTLDATFEGEVGDNPTDPEP